MGKATSALKSQEEAIRRVKHFVENMKKRCEGLGLKLVAAYIVGSRARGDYLEDSDIDLVLIIEGIENLNKLRRFDLFKDLFLPYVEVFIYTPEEWDCDYAWIKELKREAKEVFCNEI